MTLENPKYFSIGETLEETQIFGLKGEPSSLGEILEIINDFQKLGTFPEAEKLVVSNRVALRLIRDGLIKKEAFNEAKEAVDERMREYIDLPTIEFPPYRFPVRILPESKVGSNYIALVDKNNFIII